MKSINLSGVASLLALAVQSTLALAQSAPADTVVSSVGGPEIQVINSASSVSTEPLGSIGFVRELPDGRVLVNDGVRRRLLLMDTTLTTTSVVLDSLTEVSNSYGTRAGMLIPFAGDSTFFVDTNSLAVLVLDPIGAVRRIRAVWRTEHLSAFTNTTGSAGVPGVDAHGRMVYRIAGTAAPPAVPPPPGVPYIALPPDSAFIVGVDLQTRIVDTLAVVRIPETLINIRQRADGVISLEQTLNPLPIADDWAVLADGRLAVVRAIDYRVDYLEKDGTWTSSPKQPYGWLRLDDDGKIALVDSVRTVQNRNIMNSYTTSIIRWVNQYKQQYPQGFTVPEGYTLTQGLPQGWRLPPGLEFPATYVYGCPEGVEPTMLPAPGAPAGASAAVTAAGAPGAPPAGTPSCIPQPVMVSGGPVPQPPTRPNIRIVEPETLPDYRPPFATASTARGDADGNLWIRPLPTRTIPGGPVYDVINSEGVMTARYQIPTGYTIVGFGKGGVVYMSMRDASGLRLARVRLRQ